MPERQLRPLLEELDKAIEEAGAIGDQDRERLMKVQEHIQELLAEGLPPPPAQGTGLVEPIRAYIDEIEDAHPTITMTLGRIMDVLNKIGI